MTATDACECGHSIDRHGVGPERGYCGPAGSCPCARKPSDIAAARVAAAEQDAYARALRDAYPLAEQARAEVEGKVRALADEWETAHGDPPIDPSHITVRHAKQLRAALSDPAPEVKGGDRD